MLGKREITDSLPAHPLKGVFDAASLRERECLVMAHQGLSSSQIGEALGVSRYVVNEVFRKLCRDAALNDRFALAQAYADYCARKEPAASDEETLSKKERIALMLDRRTLYGARPLTLGRKAAIIALITTLNLILLKVGSPVAVLLLHHGPGR